MTWNQYAFYGLDTIRLRRNLTLTVRPQRSVSPSTTRGSVQPTSPSELAADRWSTEAWGTPSPRTAPANRPIAVIGP